MKTIRPFIFSMLFAMPFVSMAQPGTLDTSFGDDSGMKYFNFLSNDEEWMTHMVVDDQDRVWVAGATIQDGDGKVLLSRLTPDGLYDTDFGVDGYAVIDIGPENNESVQGLALHDNGLVIAGHTTTDGETYPYVMRYTLTGVLDFNFGDSGILTMPVQGVVSDVVTDEDGNIYISGMTDGNVSVSKVLPNGELDSDFGFFGFTWIDVPTQDESAALTLDDEGNIYVFGNGILNKEGILRGHISAFLPDGNPNTDFSENGQKSYTWPGNKDFSVYDGLLTADGTRFYVAGEVAYDGTLDGAIMAVDMSSDLITEFGTDGFRDYDLTIGGNEIFLNIIEGESGIYVSAMKQEIPSGIDATILHLDETGGYIDGFGENLSGWATFNISPQLSDYGTDMAFQSDGNLVVSGVLETEELGVMGFAMRLLMDADDTSIFEQYTSLSAYPNPCRDDFWIDDSEQSLIREEYRIYNMQGQVIQNGRIQYSMQRFDIGQFADGVYHLVVGDRKTARIIKSK